VQMPLILVKCVPDQVQTINRFQIFGSWELGGQLSADNDNVVRVILGQFWNFANNFKNKK
jgi:hypothetical protein